MSSGKRSLIRFRLVVFRLLFVGDVVGKPGLTAVRAQVPTLREELGLDAVVVNGENSAPEGRGINEEGSAELLSVADFVTLGNHAYDAKGGGRFLDLEPRVVRPANFMNGAPGYGYGTFEASGVAVGVVNVQGRVFLDDLRSPFSVADRAVEELEGSGTDLVLVDHHAEATSEKQALGWYLDGRVGAVVGTHTHVPTADARVLPGGTAYVTDVGMTGDEGGIIGLDRGDFLGLFLGRGGSRPRVSGGPATLNAVLIEVDLETRRATSIERVRRTPEARTC